MLCLPTTHEGYMGALAHYLYGVRVLDEPMWESPKAPPTWETHRVNYPWLKKNTVSEKAAEKAAKKAARGNL